MRSFMVNVESLFWGLGFIMIREESFLNKETAQILC